MITMRIQGVNHRTGTGTTLWLIAILFNGAGRDSLEEAAFNLGLEWQLRGIKRVERPYRPSVSACPVLGEQRMRGREYPSGGREQVRAWWVVFSEGELLGVLLQNSLLAGKGIWDRGRKQSRGYCVCSKGRCRGVGEERCKGKMPAGLCLCSPSGGSLQGYCAHREA